MAFNKKRQLENNILAIQLLFSLAKENRTANESEKEILRNYGGFGGLKAVLLPIDDNSTWTTQSDIDLKPQILKLHEILRENTGNEYKDYVNSIKNSALTAYYTPKDVVNVIAKTITNNVDVKKILDPSAGSGIFSSEFKGNNPNIESYNYEKDILTAKLLSALYPDIKVQNTGFENFDEKLKGTFDVVTSNIPFGDIKVYDGEYSKSDNKALKNSTKLIHNYFFAKGLDTIREGGILAYITSQAVMDTPSNKEIREYLMKNANLVSAIRLPNNLFSDNAGTEVGTDLIVLQKNTQKGELSNHEKRFIETEKRPSGFYFNKFYQSLSKDVVYTDYEVTTNLYGKPAVVFTHSGGIEEIAEQISSSLKRDFDLRYNASLVEKKENIKVSKAPKLPKKLVAPRKEQLDLFNYMDYDNEQDQQESIEEKKNLNIQNLKHFYKEGSFVISDTGKVGILLSNSTDESVENLNISPIGKEQKYIDYINLRDAYYELSIKEIDTKEEQKDLREKLNELYDTFSAKYKNINNVRELFTRDPLFAEFASIEIIEKKDKIEHLTKADIMLKPTAFGNEERVSINNAEDALFASLNKNGKIDFDYMSELSSLPTSVIMEQLEGKIYYNPFAKEYEIAEQLLSGNIISKIDDFNNYLMQYKALYNSEDERAKQSLEALNAIKPKDIKFEELDFNFGERWIPVEYYERFLADIMGTNIKVRYDKIIDDFSVSTNSSFAHLNANITDKYCVKGQSRTYNGIALAKQALLNTIPDVTKKIKVDGKEVTVNDTETKALIDTKVNMIRDGFSMWLITQPQKMKDALVERYNRLFNCYVKPVYNGSHQTFPDLDLSKKPYDDLYKSQKDAIWMLKQNGGGIIDHCVGGGKTQTMCIAAYEMKRLGLAKKPMILGLKANVQDIAKAYRESYPKAKVLYPTEKDFKKEERKKFFYKLKNNDWDVVILSHEQFKAIPQSPRMLKEMYNKELEDVEASLDSVKALGKDVTRGMLKGLEKRKINLSVKLEGLDREIMSHKDDVLDFEQMGIDHIFVDESHNFKNLIYNTRHNRVAGLGSATPSQKAINLLTAIRTIQNRSKKDLGATFLSGTTISNSLTELYLLFKYLRPKELEYQGISTFDAWASVYAKKDVSFEPSVTTELIQKERFRYFIKVPELANFYSQITDYKTAEDIGVDRPKSNNILYEIPKTQDQKDFTEKLKIFANTGDGTILGREPLTENEQKSKMLIATQYANKMALDMRLVDPNYDDDIDSKVSHCARNIAEYYKKYDEHKGTQFVFTDYSTFNPSKWNICSDLKRKLVEDYNIPASEIQFIQEHKTEKKKEAVIKKMKAGQVRIMMGSTQMLGTGVNAQDRAVAVHHLDIPWRPSDLEQRNGRAVRSGNKIAKHFADNTVDIITYGVIESLDAYKFGLLTNKQTFIDQIKSGANGARTIDEGSADESTGLPLAEYLAALSGNTDLLDKSNVEKEIMKLESDRKLFYIDKEQSKGKLERLENKLVNMKEITNKMISDLEVFDSSVEVDKNGEKLNKLVLDGCSSSDIKKMGEHLNEIAQKIRTHGEYRKIGSLYGFNILVRTEASGIGSLDFNENKFFVEGITKGNNFSSMKYTHNNGRIAKDPKLACDNFISAFGHISNIINRNTSQIELMEKDIDIIKSSMNNTWTKEDKLKEAKAKLAEINDRLTKALAKTNKYPTEDVQDKKEVNEKVGEYLRKNNISVSNESKGRKI